MVGTSRINEKIQIIDIDRLQKEGFLIIVNGRLLRLHGGRLVDAILKTFEHQKKKELEVESN